MPVSEALVVNPRMGLKLMKDGEQITAITVMAPVKGCDLHVTTIERSQEPQVFGVLMLHVVTQSAGNLDKIPEHDRQRLADIGFLLPDERVSTPIWFVCDLEDPPIDFVPKSARYQTVDAGAIPDLVVAPSLCHFGRDGFPAAMRGRLNLQNRFSQDRSWLWIQSEDLSAPRVYSYSHSKSAVLDELRPGEAPPAMDPELRATLLRAGVIGSAAAFARSQIARTVQFAAAGRELQQQRYTVLPHAIPPLQLAAARRYYHDLIAEGFLPTGDKDWPDRHFSGRDPIGYFFHQQLTDVVSGIAGHTVKPSFSFFASYRPGSVLPPHRDREQCEYALSIALDYSPEPDDKSPWPLCLQPPGAPAAKPVPTALGGAVLYFGREVSHHRELLTNANYSRHWFFFYVNESFSGSLD